MEIRRENRGMGYISFVFVVIASNRTGYRKHPLVAAPHVKYPLTADTILCLPCLARSMASKSVAATS